MKSKKYKMKNSICYKVVSLKEKKMSKKKIHRGLKKSKSKRPSQRIGWLQKYRGGRLKYWGNSLKEGNRSIKIAIKEILLRNTAISEAKCMLGLLEKEWV